MRIMPYIHFRGNCAEAMAAYAEILGATDLQVMRYGETPGGAPPDWKDTDRVMHSQFTCPGGTVLMASDFPPGTKGDPQQAVSIMLGPDTVAEARRAFDALAKDGAVIDDFKPTFFSPGFGMLRDRFGTHWIVAAAAPAP